MKLGEIFIQLKLDMSQFKDMLSKQKSEAEKVAKEIEKINISSSKSSSKAQLDEYNKFIAEKDRATKKAINESIKTNDKASAAVMQSNLNYEKFNRQAMSDTLKARTALNQQQLKLEKAAYNQRQKVAQDYYAADAKAQYQNAQTVQRAAASQLKNWQQLYVAQEKFAQKAAQSQDKNQYNQLTRGIEQARKEYNASLGPQKTYLQNTVDISKKVLEAAPGFAIATAAIAALYAVLRGLRNEFVRGLKAVEDYQVSVAEMAAFLTTFSENLGLADIAKVYSDSRKEAEKLVQQMEILDARTVATGRDLTIMAEQFIKGGVKIDTANQSTIDGFANIANALKLLTQGQNQEIQMRQEIRSLVQGQLRDSNILVKTLQSIDPEIKNHIVLWKQQGTLIENVGKLLVGFGPAAKDLEDNWVIIGSTMETIHNRILRGAFLPTYESLIKSAKAWNSALMNADGTLTYFAKTIQKTLMFMAKFTENFVKIAVLLAAGGAVYGAIYGIITGVNLLTFSFNALTAAMLANPLTAGLVAIAIIAAAKTINDLREANKELAEKMGDASGKAQDLSSSLGGIKPPNKDDEVWSFMDWLIGKLDKAVGLAEKLKQVQNNMNADQDRLNSQADAEIERQKNEYLSQGKSFYDPAAGKYVKPTGDVLGGQFEWMGMDEGEIKETSKNVREYIASLKEKYDELSGSLDKSAVAESNAKLKTEEFVKALEQLKNGGKLGRDEVEKLTKEVEFYSSGIDRLNKGKEINQAREDLQKLADSLLVKNAALDKSKASEMAAMLQTEEWTKKIKLAGEEGKKEVAMIMARSIALDKNAAAQKADKNLESFQKTLESQAAAFDKGDSALQKYNKNLDLLAEYLKNASPEGKKLEKTIKDLNAQILKGNISNLTEKLDEFITKYSDTGNLTAFQKGVHDLNIEYDKMIEVLNNIIETNQKLIDQGSQDVFPQEQLEKYKKALTDAKDNGLKQLEYDHDEFRKRVERIWQNMYDNLQDLTAQWLYDWKFDIDSLEDLFKKAIAEMVSAWIWGQSKMQMSSGGFGNSLSSLGGAAGISSAAMSANGSYLTGALAIGNELMNPGAYMATLGSFQTSVGTFLGNASNFLGASAKTSAAIGNSILDMSSNAFGGLTAGITTFLTDLLSGKDFVQSAAEGAGAGAGAYAGAALGSMILPGIGTAIGAILGGMLGSSGVGSLFGNNKERAYMYSNYTLDYKPGVGFAQTGKTIPYDRRGGSASFSEGANALTSSLVSSLNQLTEMFSSQIDQFGATAANQYQTFLKNFGGTAIGTRVSSSTNKNELMNARPGSGVITIGQYYQAEDAGEAQATVANVLKAFTSGVISPFISGSVNIMKKALQKDVGSLDLSVFATGAKNKIQEALNDALNMMRVGNISDEAGLTKALENIDTAMQGIQAIFEYISQIKELQASWQDIIDKNTMSDAEYQIKQLNKWYEEQKELATSLGMNLDVLTQAYQSQLDQIKVTTQGLDVNPMVELIKDYLDFVNNISFSDLAPVQSIEQYQNRFNDLLSGSRSGDAEATRSLMDFVSNQYLPFAQSFTGDDQDYKDLYNELFGASGSLRNLVVGTSDVLVDGEKIGEGILKALEPYLIPGEGGINLTIKIGDKTISDLVVAAIRSGDTELISAIASV